MTIQSFIKTGLGPVHPLLDHQSLSGPVIDINQDQEVWSCLQDLTGQTIRNPGLIGSRDTALNSCPSAGFVFKGLGLGKGSPSRECGHVYLALCASRLLVFLCSQSRNA